MKQLFTIFTMLIFAATFTFSNADGQDLPRPSQKAKVMQQVGLTEVTVTYHRPNVKDRKIFGGLVPYGQIWRTGANDAVALEVSTDVTINGQALPKGKYGFFTIPNEKEWTIIINKNWEQWGTGAYKESDDVMRFKVKAEKAAMKWEPMTFVFSDIQDDKTTLTLAWSEVKVSFDIKTDVKNMAMANMKAAIAEQQKQAKNWRVYANSARHLLDNGGDLELAHSWINTSVEIDEQWYNTWIKAQILAKQGKKDEALKAAKRANELGQKSENFFYKDQVQKAINDWSGSK